MTSRVLGLLFLLSSACSPTVTTLVQRGQIDAAVCAADDDADQRRAAAAYARAHAVRVRAHEVTATEVARDGDGFFDANMLVALDSRFDDHGAGKMTVDLSAPIADVHALAARLNERIPPPHSEQATYLTSDAGSVVAWAFFTLGFSLLFDNRKVTETHTVSVAPSEREVAASAPHATAIRHAIDTKLPNQATYLVTRTTHVPISVRLDIVTRDGCYLSSTYDLDAATGDQWHFLQDAEPSIVPGSHVRPKGSSIFW